MQPENSVRKNANDQQLSMPRDMNTEENAAEPFTRSCTMENIGSTSRDVCGSFDIITFSYELPHDLPKQP